MATKDEQATGIGSLATGVLAEEAARQAALTEAKAPVLFADDLLPGVGGEELPVRETLARYGTRTFVVLALLNSLDELESAALSVLAPDIRDTFGVSDGAIVFLVAVSSAFLVLGAGPMGWLADRFRRGRIIGFATMAFTAMTILSGFAVNIFMLFLARLGVGLAKSNTLPVHGTLLADTYPIGVRGRLAAINFMSGRSVNVLSPILVGGIAAVAGGAAGWRWAFFLVGLPVAVLSFLAFRLPEPPRGQHEKDSVLGAVIEDDEPASISIEAAFARLLQIRTLKAVLVAFSAIGFGLFTVPVMTNLFLEDHYGLGTVGRGAVGSFTGLAVLAVLPFTGQYYDRLYRRSPERALALVGKLIIPSALLVPVQFFMPNPVLFTILGMPFIALQSAAFSMVGPLTQTIVPYRLRGVGTALVTLYIFLIGAVGGSLLGAALSSAGGPRTAVIVISIPSSVVGGFLILRSSKFIRHDLSLVVAELQEELAEHERRDQDPEHVPALQVADVDFSYGHVQVLFGASFEVQRGEVLALLGTNGSGKSTLLRVVAGLGTPSRGVVRHHGRTITFAAPEERVRRGLHLLPGGKGTFPGMTVRANLTMGAYQYRHDPAEVRRRVDRALELVPALADRQDQRAASLSGGQQQLLALARTLLHDPDILMIDELSLGLAPVVVQELLQTIERLKAEGMTIIVVEQSLNVALEISDRAVFLDRGRVVFDGPAQELVGRHDIVRAVFLGGEGG